MTLFAKDVQRELKKLADPIRAELLQRFFKTGKGDYGEGDIFIGITVPKTRKVAINYKDLALLEVEKLLNSQIHEERLLALLILVCQFKKADEKTRAKIYKFYLKNLKFINNWDLVDLSSHHIIGGFLIDKDKKDLYRLAKSKHLWSRRVAVISTFNFIREKQFDDCLALAEILLHDKHDLIQKAVGWMLREVGKRDLVAEEQFLKKFAHIMPRTMLRYAIEKFPEVKRKFYLNGGR